ncbi:hemolysin D [Amylibacter marinus]|uniref:Hemolysin D n=1 Tax=Amylibacter marinus TaxID=1475483 RepID=A0ABQ5VTM3_9RHOB|nr:efflux RND transporter periplasmic adaptor subunit [Amylibacter marinus]GLQ34726.1 hemolysin D [Amylibacter marinus]
MRISSILIALVVCAGLAMFILGRGQSAEAQNTTPIAEADEKVVSVVAMKSSAQEVTSGIVLRGQTAAFKTVNVKAETSGAVISTPIRKGTLVEKGELLCELEIGTKAAALAEAKAKLLEAEANNAASANLVKKGFASETTAIAREAALEAAIAGVDRAQSDLENTQIVAPFNGLLESDTAELGDFMQPGTPCATVLALNPIKLVGYATEQQVNRISVGSQAGARLIDGTELVGQVTFLSRSADPTTRTFLVEITVPNEKLEIRDGATADILISLAGITGHLLPQSAMTLNGEGLIGVRVADQDRAKFMPINVIRDTREGIWVTGLGDTVDVIVLGQEYVTDGSKIKVTYKDKTQ